MKIPFCMKSIIAFSYATFKGVISDIFLGIVLIPVENLQAETSLSLPLPQTFEFIHFREQTNNAGE